MRLHVKPPEEPLRSEQTDRWHQAIRDVAADGDWLVVRAYTPADDAVVAATRIPLSHAGIYNAQADTTVEAHWDGVGIRPLRELLYSSHRVLLIRPRWWTEDSGKAAIKKAEGWEGRKYDFGGLIALGNQSSFYCSELAMEAYRAYFTESDHVPKVIEPGQMYLWGKVLYDSGTRD